MAPSRGTGNFSTHWLPPISCLVPRPPAQTVHFQERPPARGASTLLSPPEVRDSPGRGKGLFATETIPAFTQILADDALICLSEQEHHFELLQKYRLLPEEDQDVFDALNVSTHEEGRLSKYETYLSNQGFSAEMAQGAAFVLARFMSNAFKTGDRGGWAHAVFPNVSRINHSCAPNALSHYRPATGRQHVVALKDVQPGEEIEICYCRMLMSRPERQQRLQGWGFTCSCPVCALGSSYEEHIQKIEEWSNYDPKVNEIRNSHDHWAASDALSRCIELATRDEYPWLRATLPRLYDGLAAAREAGDQKEAADAARRDAYECFVKLNGYDHPESTIRYSRLQARE